MPQKLVPPLTLGFKDDGAVDTRHTPLMPLTQCREVGSGTIVEAEGSWRGSGCGAALHAAWRAGR